MSAYNIQGSNCRFDILVDTEYIEMACAKSFTSRRITDMKETTTVGSGFDKEFRPKKRSYTLSLSSIVKLLDEQSRPTVKDLLDYEDGFLPVNFRLRYIDQSNNPMVIRGTVYINDSTLSADPINLLGATLQMIGTGPIVREFFIPVFIDMAVTVTGIADAKCKFNLVNTDGESVYDTSVLPETQANAGWLLQGQSVTFKVLSGEYYYGFQVVDANSADNDFDLNTPAPAGPVHVDFDQNPVSGGSYPSTLHDFTANRTATFTIGEALPPPVCVDVSIVGTPELPDGEVGVPYFYSFSLAGTAPFGLTINDRPAWMDIVITGSTVEFSGTPDDAFVDIPVSITITNCSDGSANFSDTFTVEPASGDQITVEWTFVELDASGLMDIYLNGDLLVSVNTTTAGSFNALPTDQITVVVGSAGGITRGLAVTSSVSGILYDDSGTANESYTWDVVAGHDYTVSGSVQL